MADFPTSNGHPTEPALLSFLATSHGGERASPLELGPWWVRAEGLPPPALPPSLLFSFQGLDLVSNAAESRVSMPFHGPQSYSDIQ